MTAALRIATLVLAISSTTWAFQLAPSSIKVSEVLVEPPLSDFSSLVRSLPII